MTNRHPIYFIDTIEPTVHCGKEIGFVFTGGKYEIPYPVKMLPEWNHNLDTCTECNNSYKHVTQERIESFINFPNCCEWHRKLNMANWFNINDFKDLPKQYADKLFFSWFHIIHYLDADNWRKEIFDYLEYVISSFGTFPLGYGSPLWLEHYFNQLKKVLKGNSKSVLISEKEIAVRKKEIVEFLNKYYNSKKADEKNKDTDFNVLITTYNKWLKIFPFEISFFTNLKPQFEKQLPLINGTPEVNKYTGLAKVKMHTKSSLIDVLMNLTNNLLTQINTATLYEKGLLTELQKVKLELVVNERKMKLQQGYVNNSQSEEQRYRGILKEWYADEKQFIDEVTPLVKALPPQQAEANKPNEVQKNLHSQIFKGNAFEVWESLFESFGITESSRTDVKFIYEEMKKEGLIHNTVSQIAFLEWITINHNGLIVEKTSNHSRTKNRLTIYSNAKKLYKI